jgi:hypothetical protein
MSLNVSIIEEAALEWFAELGYAVGHEPQMEPGEELMVAGISNMKETSP